MQIARQPKARRLPLGSGIPFTHRASIQALTTARSGSRAARSTPSRARRLASKRLLPSPSSSSVRRHVPTWAQEEAQTGAPGQEPEHHDTHDESKPMDPAYTVISCPGLRDTECPRWAEKTFRRTHCNLARTPNAALVRHLAHEFAPLVAMIAARALLVKSAHECVDHASHGHQLCSWHDASMSGPSWTSSSSTTSRTCPTRSSACWAKRRRTTFSTTLKSGNQPTSLRRACPLGVARSARPASSCAARNRPSSEACSPALWRRSRASSASPRGARTGSWTRASATDGRAMKWMIMKMIHGFDDRQQLDFIGIMAATAKNTLTRRRGSSPAQWMCRRNPKVRVGPSDPEGVDSHDELCTSN